MNARALAIVAALSVYHCGSPYAGEWEGRGLSGTPVYSVGPIAIDARDDGALVARFTVALDLCPEQARSYTLRGRWDTVSAGAQFVWFCPTRIEQSCIGSARTVDVCGVIEGSPLGGVFAPSHVGDLVSLRVRSYVLKSRTPTMPR